MRVRSFALLVFGFLTANYADAAQYTAYYQPTPYPAPVIAKCAQLAASKNTTGCGVHILDGWLPSVYYGQTFQTDYRLQTGGWGDYYRTYIQFDLKGLPANVTNASLMLYAYPRNDSSNVIGFTAQAPATPWANKNLTTSVTWSTQPTSFNLQGSYNPGVTPGWWNIGITGLYNGWQALNPNYGVTLMPNANNDNFDDWYSSRNTVSDGLRPILQLSYTPPIPIPAFRLPLPGRLSWLVTTEAGGWDCMGNYDQYHDNANYFAVDFSWRTRENRYSDPNNNPAVNIPVLAAAGGIVTVAGTDPSHPLNGNFVVVQHGGLFTTWYLHLKKILVSRGQSVPQGTKLGYMGNTGTSAAFPFSVHLHFAMRYNNDGSANSNVRYALVDGWLMKGIQTECLLDSAGWHYIRYYTSSNLPNY